MCLIYEMRSWATPCPQCTSLGAVPPQHLYPSLRRQRDLLPELGIPLLALFCLQGPLQALFLTHGIFFLSPSFSSLISKPSGQDCLYQSLVTAPGSRQVHWAVQDAAGRTFPKKKHL